MTDEYAAATQRSLIVDRSDRRRLLMKGRAPRQMLNGIVTGSLPAVPEARGSGVWGGRSTYHAVLTPKGKMVTDLWVTGVTIGEDEGFLLDVPVEGNDGLLDLLGRALPPRFATVEDVSASTRTVTIVGPEAARYVRDHVLRGEVDVGDLKRLEEGGWLSVGGPGADSVRVERTCEVSPPAYSIEGPLQAVAEARDSLTGAGVATGGVDLWAVLRVEAGRPAFGVDMDDSTIPTEAGIDDRAIDHGKGCYTGQEVIVRIRDRGHVNRHLERLQMSDGPIPEPGTELLAPDGSGKVVGRVTSAVESPSRGVIALAYVTRGVDRVLVDGREIDVTRGPRGG